MWRKAARAHDHTVAGLVGHAIESLTEVDGRVFRSMRDLVFRPGALTAAYMRGQRRTYIPPFRIFVVATVLFFVLQSALGFPVLANDRERLWDPLTSAVLMAGCAAWLYGASRLVYTASATEAALKAVGIAGLFIPIVICYRLLVFLFTLFTT